MCPDLSEVHKSSHCLVVVRSDGGKGECLKAQTAAVHHTLRENLVFLKRKNHISWAAFIQRHQIELVIMLYLDFFLTFCL